MTDRIEALIAAIVDTGTMVLNVGWREGVSEGMRFAVVQPSDEVADPATGESLGRWEIVKAVLVATHVQERLATVRPDVRPGTDASGLSAGSGPVLSAQMILDSMPRGAGAEHGASVDPSHTRGRPRLEPIRVGDRARAIPSPVVS